ncbi:MAG TPA: hypothetical protein P5328_00980 [Candidatus Paceibacterota bacterium]|nr:hypothetical protein [Candidatus Paceibacterota bacterium]HRZ34564.1 hypothetical protein [Candidatus Paceibacterota bacterium]
MTSVASATSQTTDSLILNQNILTPVVDTRQGINLLSEPNGVSDWLGQTDFDMDFYDETIDPAIKTVKQLTEEYFNETPVLVDIAYCESKFYQFNADGSVLRGKVNPSDVGLMQINERYHAGTAVMLGYDIYSLEGNMAYAKYLYDKYGTDPWVHSSNCWNNVREVVIAKR